MAGETSTGEILKQVTIQDIVKEVHPKSEKVWINFKIIALDGGKEARIGVAAIQNSQFSLVAGLKRLNDYQKYHLTRGCLVRSPEKVEKIKRNSVAHQLLKELTANHGGEYVPLLWEQVKPLLAVSAVYENREQYHLDSEQVLGSIAEKQITVTNELLREILSDPGGEVPDLQELEEDMLGETTGENTDRESKTEVGASEREPHEQDEDLMDDLFA